MIKPCPDGLHHRNDPERSIGTYDLAGKGVAGVRRFRKASVVAWAVFFTVFLPGAGGLGESVLCFGADGHVAVEAAVSPGACYSASMRLDASADGPERELSREGDHCGPCMDVPSLSGPWANATFSTNLSGHAAWSAPAHCPTSVRGDELPASACGGLSALRHYPPVDASSAFLRTTVLLI